jgi:2-polyprenyl-3-methyl-5-hydroxy-6-metoxy-1,4-benzoquinol methylase
MDQEFWNDSYKENPEQTVVPDRVLAEEVAGLSPGRALDLGCGSGPNALMLAEKGWSVLGVDWSEHAVRLANETATEYRLNARFVAADTTQWRPSDKFDLVISTYALPGGEDSRRILQTAVDALAAGGTLIVAEWDASMAEVWNFDADDLLTVERIVALLPGLAIEKAEVRHMPDMFTEANDPRGHTGAAANVAFVRARKT